VGWLTGEALGRHVDVEGGARGGGRGEGGQHRLQGVRRRCQHVFEPEVWGRSGLGLQCFSIITLP